MSDREPSAEQGDQLTEITASIIAMATLDFSVTAPIRGSGPLDAVAAGLNALAEELESSVVAREEAENANEAKTQFLANMSHELRTPLTTIKGNIELLQKTSLDPYQANLFKRVENSVHMLQRLILDVLDFSTVEEGSLRFEVRPFELEDLLSQVMEQHQHPAERKGLVLREDRGELPAVPVLGDFERLAQVLNNLVGNGVKYTIQGHIELRTRAKIEGNKVRLEFEIRDTGPGIAEAQQDYVFGRFAKEDPRVGCRQGGVGLGLSIARSLVEAMGGLLTLESEPPHGSLFRVVLHLPMAPIEEPASPGTRVPQASGCRVLIVDDTDQVRQVTAEMLLAIGCEVATADSGQEALAKVILHDFDLIFMDCRMPGMDGLETSQQLIKLYPERNLKIVAITAHSTRRDQQASIDAGMTAHLSKPYTLQDLQQIVESIGSRN